MFLSDINTHYPSWHYFSSFIVREKIFSSQKYALKICSLKITPQNMLLKKHSQKQDKIDRFCHIFYYMALKILKKMDLLNFKQVF